MRAHARRRLKYRIRDGYRLRFQRRVPVRLRVMVRIRSQEVPGAEPTAGQWSPRRAELRAQRTVPVRITLWLPRPHMLFLPWSRKPPESFQAAVAEPGKGHGELPGSMVSQPALLRDPRRVVLSDIGIRSHWERALARVRVRSRDVGRSEATLVS